MPIEKLKQVWPEWTIEKQLGKGSYGIVYKAVRRDHNLVSYAAIKVISIPQDPSEIDSLRSEGLDLNGTRTYLQEIVNSFVGEIQLMESLKGVQNIVNVEDYKVVQKTGEIGWDIFIRMELLTPFNAYVSDKKLSEADVIKLGIDICTALEICSKRNIIHRDVKPENIFVNDFGYFKLGDFGIARKLENITGVLSQKGTFNYMAPEVANSSCYDARVDIYSLGIVLYKLLNDNRLPFLDSEKQLLNPNDRRIAVERRIRGETLPPPRKASPEMQALILRACAYLLSFPAFANIEIKNGETHIEFGNTNSVLINQHRAAGDMLLHEKDVISFPGHRLVYTAKVIYDNLQTCVVEHPESYNEAAALVQVEENSSRTSRDFFEQPVPEHRPIINEVEAKEPAREPFVQSQVRAPIRQNYQEQMPRQNEYPPSHQSNGGIRGFLASTAGYYVMSIVIALVIWGITVALWTSEGEAALIVILACSFFGWKALNSIQPAMFIWMSWLGWIIYFCVKFILSAIIGLFVAPFKIGKRIACAIHEAA